MKKNMKVQNVIHSTASVLGWTLTWAMMIFGWVAVGQTLTTSNAQGRVHMQLEDLKAFMALDTRHPSAEKSAREWNVSGLVQEELGSASTLLLSLSAEEKTRLTQKISLLEHQEELALAKIEKEYSAAVVGLKDKRRELQTSRLNSGSDKVDAETSKRIFENALEEANLAAFRDAKVSEIKEQSVVTVLFKSSVEGDRQVESIVAGNATLWGRPASSVLALRK